ncbi:MAG: hypothetical protein MK082_08685 [Phycisphaerales bacterium]|nr:hypothetical protein [Phycisphaerales bacterium]
MQSIQRARGQVTEVHNPLAALAELCTLNRSQEPRRRQNLPKDDAIALLVYNPDGRLELLPELYRSIREKLRDVELFAVESTSKGLMLIDITNVTTRQTRAPQSEQEKPSGYGQLRLAGTEREADQVEAEETGEAQAPESEQTGESPAGTNPKDPPERTLSAGELDMLLGRNEDEDPSADELE